MHPNDDLPSSNDDPSTSLQQALQQAALDRARLEAQRKAFQEKEHWVEAEYWLADHYPEHAWRVWYWEDTILVGQYSNNSLNLKGAQVSQKMFREWVSKTDFDAAMNHLLHMNQLIHWKNGNWIT